MSDLGSVFRPHSVLGKERGDNECIQTMFDTVSYEQLSENTRITMDLYTHVKEDKAHSEMQKLNQLYQMIG